MPKDIKRQARLAQKIAAMLEAATGHAPEAKGGTERLSRSELWLWFKRTGRSWAEFIAIYGKG